MSTGSYFNDFGFDPEMDYAQVLEEAGMQARVAPRLDFPASKGCKDNFHHHPRRVRRTDLVVDISCCQAHFKAAELQKSLQELKTRRSWKNSLFFWKKSHKKQRVQYSGIPTPQHPGFKSRSKPASGPLYADMDVRNAGLSCRSSGPTTSPLSGTMTPTLKGEAEIPYVSLYHHNRSRVSHTTPIYLVT